MMNRKRWTILLLLLGALVLTVVPTLAGGWATVTVENPPGEVRAGENVHIEFSVRQHGRDLTSFVTPVLRASQPQTGERITVDAIALKQTGFFAVDVVFPSEGEWEWRIDPVTLAGELQLLPLTVLPAAAPAPAVTTTTTSVVSQAPVMRTVLQVAGIVLLLAALVTAIPRRGRTAVPAISNQ